MNLCKYKGILGEPKTRIHADRIGEFALWDIVGTAAVAGLITYMYGSSSYANTFIIVLLIIYAIATGLHYIFCVQTAGLTAMGIDVKAGVGAKVGTEVGVEKINQTV